MHTAKFWVCLLPKVVALHSQTHCPQSYPPIFQRDDFQLVPKQQFTFLINGHLRNQKRGQESTEVEVEISVPSKQKVNCRVPTSRKLWAAIGCPIAVIFKLIMRKCKIQVRNNPLQEILFSNYNWKLKEHCNC